MRQKAADIAGKPPHEVTWVADSASDEIEHRSYYHYLQGGLQGRRRERTFPKIIHFRQPVQEKLSPVQDRNTAQTSFLPEIATIRGCNASTYVPRKLRSFLWSYFLGYKINSACNQSGANLPYKRKDGRSVPLSRSRGRWESGVPSNSLSALHSS